MPDTASGYRRRGDLEGDIAMTEEEVRRREKIAYQMGVQEAKATIFDDLRNLAGNFALEGAALNLPPLPDDGDCARRTLQ